MGRLYSVFFLGDILLASGFERLEPTTVAGNGTLFATLFRFEREHSLVPIAGMADGRSLGADLFPSAGNLAPFMPQVRRAVVLQARTYYLGALPHNDHQWIPFGVFAASSINDARRLAAPSGCRVYDLLVRRGRLYALGNVALSRRRFEVQVLRLREDGQGLEVAARFLAPTFARSFEFYRGNWYFGLGSEISSNRLRKKSLA